MTHITSTRAIELHMPLYVLHPKCMSYTVDALLKTTLLHVMPISQMSGKHLQDVRKAVI